MSSLPQQQQLPDPTVSWVDPLKLSYESKYPQIFEILLKKPRHRRMRKELGNGKNLTDHHVTLDYIQTVWHRALLSARKPNEGAEQGREEEYYWHRADLSLWAYYFGSGERALEFPWDYNPPSPKLPLMTQEEMINPAREESLRQQESEESEEHNSTEDIRSRQEREESNKEWKEKIREKLTREKNEAKKRQEDIAREYSDGRKKVIRKDPQRPYDRPLPELVGASLPDARVFNAFECIKYFVHGYPHRWTIANTKEFGLIYLPENWVFINGHCSWPAFIGLGGKYAKELNQKFNGVVRVCGQQIDQRTRPRISKEAQCDIHGLWVQPVRKEDMLDAKIMAACKELADQFIRSWVTFTHTNPAGKVIVIPLSQYWHTWVKGLGRKPLLIQFLEDFEISTRKRRREDSFKSDGRLSAYNKERDSDGYRATSPSYKNERITTKVDER